MKIYSLMVLARPWSSVPIMVKLSGLVLCPEVLQWPKMAKGSLGCSLYFSPKDPESLTYIFIIAHELLTLVPVDGPTLFVHMVFIFGVDKYVLDGSVNLEVCLDPIHLT